MIPNMNLGGGPKFDIKRVLPGGSDTTTVSATVVSGVDGNEEKLRGVYFSVSGLPEGIFVREDS